MSQTLLKRNTKIQGMDPMGLCAPWSDSFIDNKKTIKTQTKKQRYIFLDRSLNNCEGLNQWAFVPLGPTLTYTTSNLNNQRNYLEANKCTDYNKCNQKHRHLRHKLSQACMGRKSVCIVWIWLTGNLKSHPRTSFRINGH